ncbi:MAG: (Fe-S)-binding protein, partial [Vulcanimicrobiaceae bacterium]
LYDYGMLDLAKTMLHEILDALRPQIRAGVCVVGLEPSCVSVFRDEMVNLLHGDEDAKRLRDVTFLLSEFLAKHAPDYKPPKLLRKAVVHEHCHHKSVLDKAAEKKLLDALGVEYTLLDSGCCGMAGAFGFERGDHYDVSIKAGERVLLPAVRAAADETIIVADGFSCREQIAQTTDRQAIHPAQLLKMALDDRNHARNDAYPELRYMTDIPAEQRRAVLKGLFVLTGLIATTAAIARALRRR